MNLSELHHQKFWPPFLLLGGTALLSLLFKDPFLAVLQQANDWILQYFSWLFSWSVLFFLVVLIILYFSPFGKVKIGGRAAKPLFSKWRWFSITLCTTIATGILFWGTAEPLFHLNQPPESLGIAPGSGDAAVFSLSTMFMHWTFSPYSMYTVAGLVFAVSFYNLSQPFHTGSMLYPLFGAGVHQKCGTFIDILCLYSLAAGMAASLGAGILTIAGGLNTVIGWKTNEGLLALIGVVIVVTFVLSAASGLMKGIRILSDYNIKAFILLSLFFLIFGPVLFMGKIGWSASGQYITQFIPRSINWDERLDPEWFRSWTIFNWANWLAWTPVTALFLGRLAVGYTVREYIRINLLFPSLFGAVWKLIFSGTAIYFDLQSEGALFATLSHEGPEKVIYALFNEFPMTQVTGIVFLLITFISYVTAADSNTSAMSNICIKGITPAHQESPIYMKIVWGAIVGTLAFIMITFAGIDGIKMISVLGGFPALFLILLVGVSALRLLRIRSDI